MVPNFDEEKVNVAAANQGDVIMSMEGLSWHVATPSSKWHQAGKVLYIPSFVHLFI